MKCIRDDDGVYHAPPVAGGDFRTLCGWSGDNDEGDTWQEFWALEPTCPQCRAIIAHVGMLGLSRTQMIGMKEKL